MTRKKRGLLLFCFSLIPGAGEMYLGFFKQGISIMTVFFALIATASWLNIGPIMFVLPVLWFYSFFRVHNLAGLSDEEFYQIEDDYLFHLSDGRVADFIGGAKGRKVTAYVLILIGVFAIWNIITDFILNLLGSFGWAAGFLYEIFDKVPQVVFACLIIWLGINLIKGKKKELDTIEESEHTKNEEGKVID